MGTTPTEEQYHLKWNDYHSGLTKCFRDLRDNDEMLDVTIISDGRKFKAHKLVLSACSPVFKTMLKKDENQPFFNPFIFLHGVRSEDIQAILDFMYNGEVSVNQDDLRSFLSIAEDLRVRGLTQNDSNSRKTDNETLERKPTQPPFGAHNGSRKRMRSHSEEIEETEIRKIPNNQFNNRDHIVAEPSPRKNQHSAHSSPFRQEYPMMPQSPHTSQNSASRRGSSSMEGGHGANVSYHYLGGRDHGDPLSNLMVARSDSGWHCPDCIHIATTKGNLKSHIMSGRHKLAEKLFKCRFCDRSYSTKQSMHVHISTNHRHERDSISFHGVPNLPIPGSDDGDIRGFTKIPVNDSDDEDSDEIHAGLPLPVETTFDENSNDDDDNFPQEISGNHHQEQRSAEQLPVPEYHQSKSANRGITIETHDD